MHETDKNRKSGNEQKRVKWDRKEMSGKEQKKIEENRRVRKIE